MYKSSCMSNDAFALHELIGYSNPYNSPHELHLSAVSDIVNRGNVVNSVTLPSLSDDPGFAERERAATFSSFGSKSLNGRNALNGASNGKFPIFLNTVKQDGSLLNDKKSFGAQIEIPRDDWYEITLSKLSESGTNSAESFVSKQIQSVETKLTNNGTSSRKRKVSDSSKVEAGNTKRSKQSGNGKNENVGAKTEKGAKEKTAEPQKDYIHVRARRGEATDSHSLAERVRREKISERMKLLQDLVPGCNKATGKALMLEEIINYVQSLQRQVEFMSMKLASVNSELEFNMDNILFKDMLQENAIVPQQMNHLDSSTEAEAELYNNYDDHHQSHQNVQQLCSMDHDAPLFSNLGIQLPYLDVFSAAVPELSAFGDDDLQNIIENGFGQKNPVNFPGNEGTCIVGKYPFKTCEYNLLI